MRMWHSPSTSYVQILILRNKYKQCSEHNKHMPYHVLNRHIFPQLEKHNTTRLTQPSQHHLRKPIAQKSFLKCWNYRCYHPTHHQLKYQTQLIGRRIVGKCDRHHRAEKHQPPLNQKHHRGANWLKSDPFEHERGLAACDQDVDGNMVALGEHLIPKGRRLVHCVEEARGRVEDHHRETCNEARDGLGGVARFDWLVQ